MGPEPRTTSCKEKTESGRKEPALKVTWLSPAPPVTWSAPSSASSSSRATYVGYKVHEELTIGGKPVVMDAADASI